MADNDVPTKSTSGAAKAKASRTLPTLHKMVLEALGANKSAKGLTLQGIKKYITETYPETKENFSNPRLRTAMKKGQDNNEIIRPKSSEDIEGLTGYFLLNRALMAQNQKEQKKKTSKPVKEGKATKSPKKVAKSPEKAGAAAKSPKSPKTKRASIKDKTSVKTASRVKKTPVKKVKSTVVKTPKANKAESTGAMAKSASVKRRNKTVTKPAAKKAKK